MRYRTKPVIVEAEQWFPGKFVVGVREVFPSDDLGEYGFVTTIHGQRTVIAPGDWIITEPGDGSRHYPCKDEIFRATYEAIEDCPCQCFLVSNGATYEAIED